MFHEYLLLAELQIKRAFEEKSEIIGIYHGCMVWIEKSVTRVTDQHHKACLVMLNNDPE